MRITSGTTHVPDDPAYDRYWDERFGPDEETDMNTPDNNSEPMFEYIGVMYMRPVDRGVVLENIRKHFDNDVLPEGYYHCEIRVWKE